MTFANLSKLRLSFPKLCSRWRRKFPWLHPMFSNRVVPRKTSPSSPDSIRKRFSRHWVDRPRDTSRWRNKLVASLTQPNLTRRPRSNRNRSSCSKLPRVTRAWSAQKSLLTSSNRFSPRSPRTSLALIQKGRRYFSRNPDNLRSPRLTKSHWFFSSERKDLMKIHWFRHQFLSYPTNRPFWPNFDQKVVVI